MPDSLKFYIHTVCSVTDNMEIIMHCLMWYSFMLNNQSREVTLLILLHTHTHMCTYCMTHSHLHSCMLWLSVSQDAPGPECCETKRRVCKGSAKTWLIMPAATAPSAWPLIYDGRGEEGNAFLEDGDDEAGDKDREKWSQEAQEESRTFEMIEWDYQ